MQGCLPSVRDRSVLMQLTKDGRGVAGTVMLNVERFNDGGC